MKKFKELFEEVLGESKEEIQQLRKELSEINRGLGKIASEGRDKVDLKNDRKRAKDIRERIKVLKSGLSESKDPDKEEELQKKLLTDPEFKAWWEKMSYKNRKKEFKKKEENGE